MRRDGRGGRAGGGRNFGMRTFQFAYHHLKERSELFVGLDRVEQGLVFIADGGPIASVEIWVVESAVIGAPELHEGRASLGPNVTLPFSGEGNFLGAFAVHAQRIKLAVVGVEGLHR